MALTWIEPRFRRGILRELAPLAGMDPATVERWFDDPWIAGEHLQDLWAVFAGFPPEADTAPDVTFRGWMRRTLPSTPGKETTAVFTADQVRAFLSAIQGARLEALYVMAITTALHEGELQALRWQDIDLDAGSV